MMKPTGVRPIYKSMVEEDPFSINLKEKLKRENKDPIKYFEETVKASKTRQWLSGPICVGFAIIVAFTEIDTFSIIGILLFPIIGLFAAMLYSLFESKMNIGLAKELGISPDNKLYTSERFNFKSGIASGITSTTISLHNTKNHIKHTSNPDNWKEL